MDVGIRELKQHLSEYLSRAEHGETIRVTDRGRPKAMITPVTSGDPLVRGVDEGWIRASRSTEPLAPFQPVAGVRRVLDVLDEDRSD